MYVDEGSQQAFDISTNGVDLPELDAAPDPDAGLYIKDRCGGVVKVGIPRDCLGFQTGEALEVITKGRFKAVPHFVRGCMESKASGVARNTIAVFTRGFLLFSRTSVGDRADEMVERQSRIFTRRLTRTGISRRSRKRLWARTRIEGDFG